MSEFLDSARAELIELEQSNIEDADQVRALITTLKQKSITIRYEGISIRIPAAVPHDVKEKAFGMQRLRDELVEDGASLDEVLEPTYQMLAGLCLDEPWNKVDTWRLIEKETGASDRVLSKILEGISDSDKKIKKFR